ncbi:MAG: methyltransferase domain-containing protein [Candidatus Zapsychrus exili]|nr:methyltransferase domain-containing protein [Candidatus Zapsychrus exili]
MNVGDGIQKGISGWSFSGDVPDKFVEHIRKSVPLYDMGHDLICSLSDFFCKSESICYELGTSTGQLIRKLAECNKHKPNIRWIGIDIEEEMIAHAYEHCDSIDNIGFVCGDVLNFEYEKSDMIVSYYCMQFIPSNLRQEVFNSIYKSLNSGGAFLLFEKIKFEDADFQKTVTSIYNNYKLSQGFSLDEIKNKDKSLQGVLMPLTSKDNLRLLEKAGFLNIKSVMKYLCFEGFLAIK